jgi:hypothetical protein
MKKIALIALLVLGVMLVIGVNCPKRATAGVNINVGINVPPPPPLLIPVPPPVFVIPGTYVYFAPQVDVDIFFYHGYWYRPYRGHWYRAGSYNGKWVYISHKRVPSVLLNLPPNFRRVPPGHRHVPYGELKKNWRKWEREKYWERHGGREWHGEKWEHNEAQGRGRGRHSD